jgi:hypothetical protein
MEVADRDGFIFLPGLFLLIYAEALSGCPLVSCRLCFGRLCSVLRRAQFDRGSQQQVKLSQRASTDEFIVGYSSWLL